MPRTQSRGRGGRNEQTAVEPAGQQQGGMTRAEAQQEWLTRIVGYVSARRDQLQMLLGPQGDVDRFVAVSLAAAQNASEQLLNCSPLSIFTAIREATTYGLELGPLGDASLTPYGDEATLSVEYRGYRKLAMRDGSVRAVAADVVYENDQFRIVSGSENPRIEHEPALGERGNVKGAYAWARLANGELLHIWMTEAELLKRRNVSRSYQNAVKYNRADSIWHLWPIEMMRKTVVKRLCSEQLPLTPLLREVLERDTQVDLLPSGEQRPALQPGSLQSADARARIMAAMGLDKPAQQLPAGPVQEGAQPEEELDEEEEAAAAYAAAQQAQAQGQPPAAAQEARPVSDQPDPAAEAKTCGHPNAYDPAGGEPCQLPAGHPGFHKNGQRESWA